MQGTLTHRSRRNTQMASGQCNNSDNNNNNKAVPYPSLKRTNNNNNNKNAYNKTKQMHAKTAAQNTCWARSAHMHTRTAASGVAVRCAVHFAAHFSAQISSQRSWMISENSYSNRAFDLCRKPNLNSILSAMAKHSKWIFGHVCAPLSCTLFSSFVVSNCSTAQNPTENSQLVVKRERSSRKVSSWVYLHLTVRDFFSSELIAHRFQWSRRCTHRYSWVWYHFFLPLRSLVHCQFDPSTK